MIINSGSKSNYLTVIKMSHIYGKLGLDSFCWNVEVYNISLMTTIGRSIRKCTAMISKTNINNDCSYLELETTIWSHLNFAKLKGESTAYNIQVYKSHQKHYLSQSHLRHQNTNQVLLLKTRTRILFPRTLQTKAGHFFYALQTFYNW